MAIRMKASVTPLTDDDVVLIEPTFAYRANVMRKTFSDFIF
jgi:hypothetical protein